MTVDQGLEACTKLKGCTGITFDSPDTKGGGQPLKIYFKNGSSATNGATDWQSWVVDRTPSHWHLPRFYYQVPPPAGTPPSG